MNGQKAKALRKLARYSVTSDRPALPAGGWPAKQKGTMVLPKAHSRSKYHFLKREYHMVPIAHTLKRMHNSTRLVEAIDRGIQAQAQSA